MKISHYSEDECDDNVDREELIIFEANDTTCHVFESHGRKAKTVDPTATTPDTASEVTARRFDGIDAKIQTARRMPMLIKTTPITM